MLVALAVAAQNHLDYSRDVSERGWDLKGLVEPVAFERDTMWESGQ